MEKCPIHLYIYVRLRSTSNPQIGIQFSNIWPFFTFSNRRILQIMSHPLGNVFFFEAMMEKGQDQIPNEGFLMTKMPMYFIVTVGKILLCLGVLLL
jgi:hypothetical protein